MALTQGSGPYPRIVACEKSMGSPPSSIARPGKTPGSERTRPPTRFGAAS